MNALSFCETSQLVTLVEFWTILDNPVQHNFSDYSVFLVHKLTDEQWSSNEGEILFQKLYQLTQSGFCREKSESLKQNTKNHVKQSEFLYLVTKNNSIIAYAVFDYLAEENLNILYLSGIMVSTDYQGQGVAGSLIRLALNEFQTAKYLTVRTQSPIMYESIQRCCEDVYPNTGPIPQDIALVGQVVASKRLKMKNYNTTTMTAEGVYGSALYGIKPRSNNEYINNWFNTNINLDRGDAMIIVARK